MLFVGADIIVLALLYALRRRPARSDRRVTTIAERMPQTMVGMRHVAWVGIAVGALAACVALPPIDARTRSPRVVLGLIAVTLGVGVMIRGERRMGAFAVVAGVVGAGDRLPRDPLQRRQPRDGRRLVGAARRRCSATRPRSSSPRSAGSSRSAPAS